MEMVWCFSREEGVKRLFCPQCWSRMGPQTPCWQGRSSCGPTRFGCGCHTVVLMCTRDASFGAQLEEESWTGMIAVMRHPFSIKSGAPPGRSPRRTGPLNGRRPCLSLPPIIQERETPWSWPMGVMKRESR